MVKVQSAWMSPVATVDTTSSEFDFVNYSLSLDVVGLEYFSTARAVLLDVTSIVRDADLTSAFPFSIANITVKLGHQTSTSPPRAFFTT